jgi:hypothetical protein
MPAKCHNPTVDIVVFMAFDKTISQSSELCVRDDVVELR